MDVCRDVGLVFCTRVAGCPAIHLHDISLIMASVRMRKGRFYYRYKFKGKCIERGSFNTFNEAFVAGTLSENSLKQKVRPVITKEIAEKIFERFPQNHPAHIPLLTIYQTGCSLKEAYEMKIDDVNFKERRWLNYELSNELIFELKRQINRILDLRIMFMYPDRPEYVNIYFKSGKRISSSQIYYVTKVIQKDICPGWNYRDFAGIATHLMKTMNL